MYVAEKKKMIPISRVILVFFEILQIAVHYLETIQNNAVADPGFSRGGGVNTPNFPENCMKSKEFGRPGGGRASLTPPPRSANAMTKIPGGTWILL